MVAAGPRLDTMRFRTDSVLNRTIREVATRTRGQGRSARRRGEHLRRRKPAWRPWENLFLEHVHMNSPATTFSRVPSRFGRTPLDGRLKSSNAALTEKSADRLAYTAWNEMKVFRQVVNTLFKQPPFTLQSDRTEREPRWKAKLQTLQRQLGPDGMKQVATIYEKAVAERPRTGCFG